MWFLTGSKDHKIKLFDIRKMDQEMQSFEAHDDKVNVVTWHPTKEELFASASNNGQIILWSANQMNKPGEGLLHKIENAH